MLRIIRMTLYIERILLILFLVVTGKERQTVYFVVNYNLNNFSFLRMYTHKQTVLNYLSENFLRN